MKTNFPVAHIHVAIDNKIEISSMVSLEQMKDNESYNIY